LSGPNEHYLPRLVQSGFLIDGVNGKKTFLTTKFGTSPKSTRSVGSEDFFNSGDETGKHIDASVTSFEQMIGNHLHKWRQSNGCVCDPDLASRLVMHLVIRGKHLRELILGMGSRAFSFAFEKIFNKERITKQILKSIKNKNSQIRTELRDKCRIEGYVGSDLLRYEEFALTVLIDGLPSHVDKLITDYIKNFPTLFLALNQAAPDSHRKYIAKDIEGVRYEALRKLSWKIVQYENCNFVLPDSCVIMVPATGPCGPIFTWDREVPHAVVMPISGTKLLVGGNETFIIPQELNQQLAMCSSEFFISKTDSHLHGLKSLIGDANREFEARAMKMMNGLKL
jgi:hypothetical protein